MDIKVHILGSRPSEIVKGEGKNRRTNTSAIISYNGKNILINISKFLDEHMEEADYPHIDAALISHGHNDCTGGIADFKKMKKKIHPKKKLPVFCEKDTWERINEDFEETGFIDFHPIYPGKDFKLFGMPVTPFRVKHSRSPEKFPAVGYRFSNKLVWCEDTTKVPDYSEPYFNGVFTVILDAAMWFGDQIFNHFNTKEALEFMKDKSFEHLFLIQIGRSYPDFEEAEKKVKKYWEKIGEEGKVDLAYDGLEFTIEDHSKKEPPKITLDSSKIDGASDEELLFWNSALTSDDSRYRIESNKKLNEPQIQRKIQTELEERDLKSRTVDKDLIEERIRKLTKELEDATIGKNVVAVTGSYLEKEDYNDIDFFVKADSDYMFRAMVQRVRKMLPEEMERKAHFWTDIIGPHSSFIPIFDVKLEKTDSGLVKMNKEKLDKIPHKPMKPSGPFYDVDKIIKKIYDKGTEYFVERKYDGFHIVIEVNDGEATVWTEEGKKMAGLSSFLKEPPKIGDNFVIDGELLWKEDGELGSRVDLMPFIEDGDAPSDKNVELVSWDITDYQGEDLTDKTLAERKKVLDKLDWGKSNRVDKIKTHLVDSKSDIKDMIKKVSDKPESEGAVIKKRKSKYHTGEEGNGWWKYRLTNVFHMRVINKNPTKGGNCNYEYGFDISDKEAKNIPDKYIKEVGGQKVHTLGNTFNTDKCDINEGEIIDVRAEEVWRHEEKDSDRYRYSVHKPLFEKHRPDLENTASLEDLDEVVVSLGVLVVEDKLSRRLINSLSSIKSLEVSDKQLIDDFRVVLAWWSMNQNPNRDIRYNSGEIVDTAKQIYEEIERRKKNGELDYNFNPKSKTTRDLYKKLNGNEKEELSKEDMIGSVGVYDPSDMSNKQLQNDWRVLIMWAGQLMEKGEW